MQGVNALLNVVYTFIGHALIPSFVGDMEQPRDFPKALAVSMAAEFILFTLTGAIVYHYTGTEYATAPAYGSLRVRFGKVAAGFVLPTIISKLLSTFVMSSKIDSWRLLLQLSASCIRSSRVERSSSRSSAKVLLTALDTPSRAGRCGSLSCSVDGSFRSSSEKLFHSSRTCSP